MSTGNPFLDAAGISPGPQSAPSAAPGPSRSSGRVETNNPYNLKPGFNRDGSARIVYPGQTGVDYRGIATFGDPAAARQAAIGQLQRYQQRAGRPLTYREIAKIYAPASDNNDPDAYSRATSKAFGATPDTPIDLSDPTAAARLADAHMAVEQGHPVTGPSNDANNPFLTAMSGGNSSTDVGGRSDQVGNNDSGGGTNLPVVGMDGAGQNGALPPQASTMVDSQTGATLGQRQKGVGGDRSQTGNTAWGEKALEVVQGAHDALLGLGEGPQTVVNDAYKLLLRGTDAAGLTSGALEHQEKVDEWAKQHFTDKHYFSPEGWSRAVGNFAGEGAMYAPLAEIAPFSAGAAKFAPEAKLAAGLAKYSDLALQGATAGTIASGGRDIAKNAELGALLAPVGGAVIEHAVAPTLVRAGDAIGWAAQKALPPAEKLIGATKSFNTRMSEALRARMAGEMAPKEAPPLDPAFLQPGGVDAATFAGKGYKAAADNTLVDAAGKPVTAESVHYNGKTYTDTNKDGVIDLKDEGVPDTAANVQVSPQRLAAAIGNRASQRGIESTNELPSSVAARYRELTDQGVPDAQALRQADIEGIGASPTVATTTRTPADMRAMFEGAKAGTPEGDQLSSMIANNSNALHQHVQGLVQDLGGVPAEGSAAEAAARTLAQASDTAKAKVRQAYTKARAADGDERVSIDALRELLDQPEYQAPTTTEGKQLIRGLSDQIDAMSKKNGGRFSPDEIDQLTKAANRAYSPMGGGANDLVAGVKKALSESLDQFDKAGPAYRDARALHRRWAEQYDDPQGISRLIQRDAQGNFVKDGSWRAAENIISTKDDKSFIQIVNQLRKNGSTEALDSLKATVIQQAYERASNGAADRAGNQTLIGQRWFNELNKIGMPKLKALFSPEEIASLAHIGRASIHLNEAVPGAVNTSSTASTTLDALNKKGGGAPTRAKIAARVVGHGVAAFTHPGVGNLAVEGIVGGADRAVTSHNAAKLASALRDQMDPASARANASRAAIRAADAMRRAALANTLARRTAPAIAAENGSRK